MLVGYARVSTLDQSHNLQTDALKRAGCDRIFTETISGASRHRPELEKALAFARKSDVLVVWKLDRLGRSTVDLLLLLERLHANEIELRSLTETVIDTTSPLGKAIFAVAAVFSQLERDNLRQRVLEGKAASRARGVKDGRPLRLSPEQERQVVTLHESGKIPVREICRQFNIGRRTMWRTIVRVADRDRVKREADRLAAAERIERDLAQMLKLGEAPVSDALLHRPRQIG
jgi:DNA invertase Pin-like site-specific DNA recombinase